MHAVVVPKAGQTLTEAMVIAHCKARLTPYKCPRSVAIWAQALPLSGTGKIMKSEPRQPFWAGRTRRV